ncbi:hypothetical protein DL96DRAFT_1581740 [Flagelloscypha sp. PMI_526]|nr:hypothetical protein DL96DRAFT_1581740 [Flagelloscypha sp. PMI_526]
MSGLIFDRTALRTHSDGTKAGRKRTLKTSKAVSYDSRGNLIASDAGGPLAVPGYSTQEIPADSVRQSAGSNVENKNPKKYSKKRKAHSDASDGSYPRLSKKAKKRREFAQDLEFLEGSSKTPLYAEPLPYEDGTIIDDDDEDEDHEEMLISSLFTEVPSTELLNSIHHYAATYWSECGQLSNESKLYRQRRKLRGRSRSATMEGDDSEPEATSPAFVKRGKTRVRPHEWAEWGLKQDMYRVLDGSALVAIGMLVQSYVGVLLSPQKPPGWDIEFDDGDEQIDSGPGPEANQPFVESEDSQSEEEEDVMSQSDLDSSEGGESVNSPPESPAQLLSVDSPS